MNKQIRNALEWAGYIAAVLCLIDCLVLPLVLAISPFLGLHEIIHGLNDQFATLLVVVLCCVAFFPSFLRHRNLNVAALMSVGIFFVFFGNLIGDRFDKTIHVLLCVAGSLFIFNANRMSRKLISTTSCCDHRH